MLQYKSSWVKQGGALQTVTLPGSNAALKDKGETMPLSMMMHMEAVLTRASVTLLCPETPCSPETLEAPGGEKAALGSCPQYAPKVTNGAVSRVTSKTSGLWGVS